MNDYKLYDTADFVLDEDFILWVYQGRNDDFWAAWVKQNPAKFPVISEAKRILQSLEFSAVPVEDQLVKDEVSKLLSTICVNDREPLRRSKYKRTGWWAAAALLIITGIAALVIKRETGRLTTDQFSYKKITSTRQLAEHINTSDKPLIISMPDGSTAELASASRLSYANDFKDSANRDVYLSGEAFFNVAKNPGQPFRVFANGVVTKVLGTSFKVRSFENENTIKVTVRTGKVKVYSQSDDQNKTELKAIRQEDVLLTPNQEVIFLKEQNKFQKALLDKPVIIDPRISIQSLVFEEAPVIKVLEQFKKAYGINIIYDEESLKNCTITADLTDELLYTKLDLVCKAIDAEYEIIGSEIFIRTKGCH